MATMLKGATYYRTSEVARMVGISRSTLLRWLANGSIKDTAHRDRRGWRLFTSEDVKRIEEVANTIT